MRRDQLEALADVWRTIRSSEYGSLALAEMSKDDARAVMDLFDEGDRRRVSDTLNDCLLYTSPSPRDS